MNKNIIFAVIPAICLLSGCASSSTKTQSQSKKLTPQEMIKNNMIEEAKEEFSISSDINSTDDEGNTVLHLAAKINDPDLVTYFMLKGADPDLKNYESDTPLHVAVKNNCLEAARAITAMNTNTLFARDADGITAIDLGLKTDDVYYDIFITTKAGEVRDTEGQTIVHYFVKTKNLRAIQQCIKKNIPISVKDDYGKTPLDAAFEDMDDIKSVEIAAELIMGGADDVTSEFSYFQNAISVRNVNTRFDDGQTPLHLAAISNHLAITEYLLQNSADTKVQDSSGATPLHEAVRYGNLEIAKLLLNSGANINARDNIGKTPVMLIFPQDKMLEIYSLLVSYKADLLQKDMYGDTVLHTAAMLSVPGETLSLLVRNCADVNARNKEGVTPLEISIKKNDVLNAKFFTSNGANIHTQDTYGDSPLTLALNGSTEILEAVVNSSNALSQDSEGNTPLHIALLNDATLAKVQYIISLTSDVDIRNRDGNSPLFIAVLKNRQKVGEILLAKGADIFATNKNNNSPLRLALRYGGSVQDWLITSKTITEKDGSGNSVLHYAAEWEYDNAVTFLLSKGADVSVRNANGETPLFSAAKTNNPQIIQLLIDGGADVHARDNLGSTPMHVAVRWEAPLSVEALIKNGGNVNVQNSAGKSPLAETVVASKYDLAKELLKLGADPNSSDTNGVTVIMDAIRGNDYNTVKLLLDYGANPNIQEINGRNAYHEAAFMGNKDVIRLLYKAGGNPLARDKQGLTPFAIVLDRDIDTIMEVLGDSYNITDSDGNTPIHLVVKAKGKTELLRLLIEEGYPLDTRNSDGYTALNYAIEMDDVKTAQVLLENGANPFQMIDKKGRNGISIALEHNNMQMISNIVKYAGKLTDVQGNSILHYAAKTCSADTVKQLIAYGIDKSIKNVAGDTAYTIAVRWKKNDVAELLK